MSPIKVLFLGVSALVLSIVIELALSHAELSWIGLKPGTFRVIEERSIFLETFDRPFLLLDPRSSANRVRIHVRQLHTQLQNPTPIKSQFLHRFRTRFYATVSNLLPAVEVFSLRALSLLATLPLIAIGCVIVGLDGWVRREVRKAGAGLESARIYHVAKRSVRPICLWVSLLYLTVPVTVDVRWAYGLLTIVIPTLVGIMVSRFKKYL